MRKTTILGIFLILALAGFLVFSFYSRTPSGSKLSGLEPPPLLTGIFTDNSSSSSSTPLSSVSAQSSQPTGLFTLDSPNQDDTVSLNNPNISGIALGGQWEDFEKTRGQYDWSSIDAKISAAKTHGKQILLRLTSGGSHTPAWAKSGVQLFSFIDSNEYHGTYGQSVTIPVFWDPVFLAEKKQLIADAGSRFSSMGINAVAASCANASTNDWNTASKTETEQADWNAAGFTPEKLINACEEIIDATAAAFPNSVITLSVGSSDLLDPSPNYISKSVIDYAATKYPGRFISENNGLSATGGSGKNGKVSEGPAHGTAGQMLWFVTDDPTCRMNGKKTPCDAATMLSQAIANGASKGMQFIEIYEKDVNNPALAEVIKEGAVLLKR